MLKSIVSKRHWWRGYLTVRTISAQNYHHQRIISHAHDENQKVASRSSNTESNSRWCFNIKVFMKGVVYGTFTAFSLWALKNTKSYLSLEAAKVIDQNDEKSKLGLSRRDRFNFVADVVTETGASLVYIKIKDKGFRDFYTGEATTVSNGSGHFFKLFFKCSFRVFSMIVKVF